MGIAATANAATSGNDALTIMGKIGDNLADFLGFIVVFTHDSANGNFKNEVFTIGAVHLRTLAMGAARCFEMMFEAIVDQRRNTGIGFKHDIATLAAVAAVGAALRDVRLTTKRHAARAAIACFKKYANLVCKHYPSILNEKTPCDAEGLFKVQI